jgi:hypothetical protein
MYLLDAIAIRNPQEINEVNSTQYAQQKALSGAVGRDYFGSNKRVWVLSYRNIKKAQYDPIKAIYDSYLSTGEAKTWEVTETNYQVSATTVHIDLRERSFSVGGLDYISDFDLILTES